MTEETKYWLHRKLPDDFPKRTCQVCKKKPATIIRKTKFLCASCYKKSSLPKVAAGIFLFLFLISFSSAVIIPEGMTPTRQEVLETAREINNYFIENQEIDLTYPKYPTSLNSTNQTITIPEQPEPKEEGTNPFNIILLIVGIIIGIAVIKSLSAQGGGGGDGI